MSHGHDYEPKCSNCGAPTHIYQYGPYCDKCKKQFDTKKKIEVDKIRRLFKTFSIDAKYDDQIEKFMTTDFGRPLIKLLQKIR